ncbi:MAG: leucyl/phenylalanyl-tRNA--protein transferase [Sulfurovaceae bacterium]|nr:leucyl/phenylalanyl-tRNA--protein transferase [Sulfurovaceae bacterium]
MASMFDDDYLISPLGMDHIFPNPRNASDEGLLAFGGDLSPSRLLTAYKKGIFPWYSKGDPILWWSPDPRLLLYPSQFKVSKSFRKTLKSKKFEVKFDTNFSDVIRACAYTPREGQNGTWILPEMQEAYLELHRQGFAHSVESYIDGKLVGGLYGIAIGKAFFGESMFSHVSDASKVVFKALSDVLALRSYDFIDCQIPTEHLKSLGAVVVCRDEFLDSLKATIKKPGDLGSWQHYKWEYNDAG